MKILIGVDASPHSEAALEFVAGLTWARDAQVIVLSAANVPVPVVSEIYAPVSVDLAPMIEESQRAAREVVARGTDRLRKAGLAAAGKVAEGDPRVALVEAAREESADLIVVGSHGRTGVEKLLMGSVASHVVSHAPCSVLVTKTPHRK